MKIKKVEFTDFRNIESEEISFSDGINVMGVKMPKGKRISLREFIFLQGVRASAPQRIRSL